jgi:hypothetical protein
MRVPKQNEIEDNELAMKSHCGRLNLATENLAEPGWCPVGGGEMENKLPLDVFKTTTPPGQGFRVYTRLEE